MGWQDKYKVIGIVPGKVKTKKYGIIDFSSANVSEELCEALVKEGFQYLEKITPKKLIPPSVVSDEKAAV